MRKVILTQVCRKEWRAFP